MKLGRIDLPIPDDWEDHSLYTFVAPAMDVSPQMRVKASTFRKNVVIQKRLLGPEEDLASCTAFFRQTTEATFADVKIEVRDGPKSADFESSRVVYTVIDDVTRTPVAQVVYLVLVGQEEWQVAFSLPAMSLKEALPGFDAMMAQLRVR